MQGLSLALFIFAFLGNTFYVLSILSSSVLWKHSPPKSSKPPSYFIEPPSPYPVPQPSDPSPLPPWRTPQAQAFLKESLPYLLGSAGTLAFDVVIVTQGLIYGRRDRLLQAEMEKEEEEDEEYEEEEGNEPERGPGPHTPEIILPSQIDLSSNATKPVHPT